MQAITPSITPASPCPDFTPESVVESRSTREPIAMLRNHLALASIVAVLASAPTDAATYTVTRHDDPLPNGCQLRDCSLREAAMAADATAVADTIQLSSGTYELTRTGSPETGWFHDLDFSGEVLTLQGEGSTVTRIRSVVPIGFDTDGRILQAWGGALTIKGVALEHGRQADHAIEPRGGCLFVALASTVVLKDVALRDCSASEGGAAMLSVNQTVFEGVVVEGNRASRGGGIWLPAGQHYWTGVRIRQNTADIEGGGLLFSHGTGATLWLDAKSSLTQNSAAR